MRGSKILFKSSCDEWATPYWVYDRLNKRFNFQLDPCANEDNFKCVDWYNKEINGLNQEWSVNYKSVFVNPPYSDIKKWVEKCYNESLNGCTVVMLIPARIDTTYWHDYIFPYAKEIIFIRGRLRFNDCKNNCTFPSAIIIFKKSLFRLGVKTSTIKRNEDEIRTNIQRREL